MEMIIDYPKEILTNTLVYLGERNPNVVFISCDTSLGCGAEKFKKLFPERHIEFGIQEQNAIVQAAGLALSGKIPFIGAHACFIVLRCIEQIRNALCKTHANVKIIGRDFGLQLSTCGPTHMILEDIGMLRMLPNLTIIAPSDSIESREALLAASEIEGPVYIRFSRHPSKRVNKTNYKFEIGKGIILREGKDLTIISTSTMVSRCLDAAEILGKKGINAEVVNIHTLKPIDKDIIIESSSKTKRVVTVEEHSLIGGLGSAVAEILINENSVKLKIISTGVDFAVVGPTYEELLKYYGLAADALVKEIENFLENLNFQMIE